MSQVSKSIKRILLPVIASAATAAWMTGCDDGAANPGTAATESATATSADAVSMEFDVKGMFCEGCVFAVRSAIAELDGVETCDVSLADERATVTVRDADAEKRIIEAVEKLDFTITRRAEHDLPNADEAVDG